MMDNNVFSCFSMVENKSIYVSSAEMSGFFTKNILDPTIPPFRNLAKSIYGIENLEGGQNHQTPFYFC